MFFTGAQTEGQVGGAPAGCGGNEGDNANGTEPVLSVDPGTDDAETKNDADNAIG